MTYYNNLVFDRAKTKNEIGLARPWARPKAGPVIRPEHAWRADLHENAFFVEKRRFRSILVISGPSRPQKWIRLEILRWKMVSGGLET